jgi:hypothetical protein
MGTAYKKMKEFVVMKRPGVCLIAALLFFHAAAPFCAEGQTTEKRVETGRFGAEEPLSGDEASGGDISYKNHWLFLGARLGPSLRFYTPSEDTAFTGGDTYGVSLDLGLQASLQIVPAFSVQAEMVFTWDNASRWEYALNPKGELDRYTRRFTGFSLQIPLSAKLNFYPGDLRVSPFLGGYFLVPLGKMEVDSPLYGEGSYSYSISPPLGVLGGLNVGFPLESGTVFFDIRCCADLGKADLRGGEGMDTFRRSMVSLSVGYEFGFFKKQ